MCDLPTFFFGGVRDTLFPMRKKPKSSSPPVKVQTVLTAAAKLEGEGNDLVALFRLLLREPPKTHDCRRCAICKAYGMDGI
jgi:hypothetical protein